MIPPLPAPNVNAPAVPFENSAKYQSLGTLNSTENVCGNSVTSTTAMGVSVTSGNKIIVVN